MLVDLALLEQHLAMQLTALGSLHQGTLVHLVGDRLLFDQNSPEKQDWVLDLRLRRPAVVEVNGVTFAVRLFEDEGTGQHPVEAVNQQMPEWSRLQRALCSGSSLCHDRSATSLAPLAYFQQNFRVRR